VAVAKVRNCQRLAAEFQHFFIRNGALRKVFLSIKGIYYQADIRGEKVTWMTPWQFSQEVRYIRACSVSSS
jgi:pescadillo protein